MRAVLAGLLLAAFSCAEDWPRFRGPNGSGVAASSGLPSELGPTKNLLWRVDTPPGHSSPIVYGDRVFFTGIEKDRLVTLCLRSQDGALLWKRECPRLRRDTIDKRNNAASPTPVAGDGAVYVFFQEFGLISYTLDGGERWRLPLGPFDNFYGMGASPIVAGSTIVLVCDQKRGSFVLAVDKNKGTERWRRSRPEAVSGHSTPVLYQAKGGPLQVIAPGSFRMNSYQAETGEPLWHADGLASEMKSVPVVDGDVVYINGYNMPDNDPGKHVAVPDFAAMRKFDGNNNGFLERAELPEGPAKKFLEYIDMDGDGRLDAEEWEMYRKSMAAENALLAINSAGRVLWKFHRSIPQLPSTVLYGGILYMISDGGILTSLDPKTGEAFAQTRLRTAADKIYASPVAADGKVFFVTEGGVIAVRKAGKEHSLLSTTDLEEPVYATPAIAGGRIFIRSTRSLFCFGLPKP
ncbi:MAG: PQQ-binding-like beta-propeller repeat protein [Candidatus Solibacter usitatus]|nr:PQQ-binding-like beta-propeller repeat protein [Candidatus Solibacter usitatus]